MTKTRLPRLLDGELKELDRLHALRLSLTQNLAPLSTASMELPPGQAVKLRQLVELFTPHGSAGVFRITAVQSTSGGVSKVTLSHGLCTLSDAMLSGSGESTGTARDILTAILATQTTWALGSCETDDTPLTWSWDNSNTLEALTDLMAELPEHYLAFDQSALPWKLHVLKLTDAAACECKLNRSMTGITIKEDDSQLCTRLTIPNVDAPMNADTIGTWGVISRVLEADPDLPQDMLLRAAQAYLEENKNPKLTISIDAVELARRTGDPFDRFTCGKMCRTSLDDGAPIHQRIVRLQYTDLIGSPDVCKITLASTASTASAAIAGLVVDTTLLINKVSGNKKQLRLQAEEIDLLAREISLKASQTTVDGLGAQLSQVSLDLDAAETALIAKAEKAELQDVNTRLTSAELYLFGAEGKAGLVTQVYENSELIGQARIDLDAANSKIAMKADKIELEGYVTMEEFKADFASLTDGYALEFSTTDLYTSTITLGESLNAPGGYVSANTLMASASITVGGEEVATQAWLKNSGYITNGALAGYATQSWVEGKGYATQSWVNAKGYATQDWVSKQGYLVSSDYFDLQAWVNDKNYMHKSGLTTATTKVCTGTQYTTATTPPFYNANGTQVSGGITYVKSVTYNTTDLTYLVYA